MAVGEGKRCEGHQLCKTQPNRRCALHKTKLLKWVILLVLVDMPLRGQVNILTQHNNNGRTGANLNETTLTVANVNKQKFGKLAYRTVDGNIYAQPLIVSHAKVRNGSVANVAIVATENNSVYAFDADDTNQSSTTAQ